MVVGLKAAPRTPGWADPEAKARYDRIRRRLRLPFLVCALVPLAVLPVVHLFMPQEYISSDDDPAPRSSE